ncbi:two-component sensor histidine kinase, partial [Blautia producta]|nr:two-component sensor histidine kinase [Blautia producta]
QRKADSLSRMISQLLLLSRADQGREKVTMEILDFTVLSQMAAAEMEGIAAAKGIRLETAISPDIMVRGDETLLIRLWLNLLQNAVTYGKEVGCIHMGLWEDE